MNRRIYLLGLLIVAVLTAIAFTAGGGAAQTTGSSTAGTGSATATRPATGSVVATVPVTVAATVAATATRAASAPASAVATGTGGVTTVPVSGTTGRAQASAANFLPIEGLVLGLAVLGTGIMLRRRATRG